MPSKNKAVRKPDLKHHDTPGEVVGLHVSCDLDANDTLNALVAPTQNVGRRDLFLGDTLIEYVARPAFDNVSPLIAEIIEAVRQRKDYHSAEKRITLQVKGICRRIVGGDKLEANKLYKRIIKDDSEHYTSVAFLLPIRASIKETRMGVEKHLASLALQLPVANWWCSFKGLGLLGLALIVGEAGDISGYSTPAKLWRRFGLAVFHGTAQGHVKSFNGRYGRAMGADAIEHGYAPARRSVMWTIHDSMFKSQGPDAALRRLYDERKNYELLRGTEKGTAHRRAGRYVEKRLLLMLWQEWRKTQLSII